jgi:hypothetical protein
MLLISPPQAARVYGAGANEPNFSPVLMCDGIGKGFANAYKTMADKDEGPETFCSNIVQNYARNSLMCPVEGLIEGCIKQIQHDAEEKLNQVQRLLCIKITCWHLCRTFSLLFASRTASQ